MTLKILCTRFPTRSGSHTLRRVDKVRIVILSTVKKGCHRRLPPRSQDKQPMTTAARVLQYLYLNYALNLNPETGGRKNACPGALPLVKAKVPYISALRHRTQTQNTDADAETNRLSNLEKPGTRTTSCPVMSHQIPLRPVARNSCRHLLDPAPAGGCPHGRGCLPRGR